MVRKELADAEEYESCQQNDMEVDVGEHKGGVELRSHCGGQLGWMA